MEFLVNWVKQVPTTLQVTRWGVDAVLVLVGVLLLATGVYIEFEPALQVVVMKVLMVSAGIIHGHVAGKVLFPKVDWTLGLNGAGYARIALYVAVTLAYALGG
jgi:hypothetical protein